MAIFSISGIRNESIEGIKTTDVEKSKSFAPLLQFAERDYGNQKIKSKSAKKETKDFTNTIMKQLDTSKSKRRPDVIMDCLEQLIKVAQTLNGVQKNHLKPQGNKKQNKEFNERIEQSAGEINTYVEQLVNCGLSVVKDSKTGLYKLCVNNKLYDIPERQVEIVAKEMVVPNRGPNNELLQPLIEETLWPEIVD